MKHPDINYIILVPEQFTMQTQKELVLRHPRHGIMNIDVLSFCTSCFSCSGRNREWKQGDSG